MINIVKIYNIPHVRLMSITAYRDSKNKFPEKEFILRKTSDVNLGDHKGPFKE